MNNLNNNFLDQEVDDALDETTDEIIEEIEEQYIEEAADAEQTASVLNEAMKRIEQANLYKALLDHDLFAPGSARPEIIHAVKKEFKGFILQRLEILLGIKPDVSQQPQVIQQVAVSQFDDDEVQAMKAFSRRLIERNQQVAPQVQTVTPNVPKIQALQAQPVPMVQAVTAPNVQLPQQPARTVKVVRKIIKRSADGTIQSATVQPEVQTPTAAPIKKARGKREKSNNVSAITGEELGQASSPERPPMKMPSQAQMDMMNAQQAEQNARGAARSTQGVGIAINKVLGGG